MTSVLPKFAVLLAAYNGIRWLPEQVASIFAQTGVDITVFVSVDLSTDGTEQWIDELAEQQARVVVLPHGRRFGGAAPNFFRLLREVDFAAFDYVCLADQDDIWLPDKGSRSRYVLEQTHADAYSSNVIAFWPSGQQRLIHKAQAQRKWDFLFEAAGPGCTYVLTRTLACAVQDLLRDQLADAAGVSLHDWFIYAFARANNFKWIIDDHPGLMYRQHGNNQLGVNHGWRAYRLRAHKIWAGWVLRQSSLIARLVGQDEHPFVKRSSRGNRLDLVYLALRAGHCRRRLRDRVIFGLSCLALAIKPRRK